jgi:sialic acid synthase SpsE
MALSNKRFSKRIKIGNNTIGSGYPPYIIAEMACAHNGDFESVKKLIDESHAAGANATQLQIFDIEEVVTPTNDLKPVLEKVAFSKAEWTELFNYGRKKGIDVMICTYDLPSVKLAIELGADAIKLNSADLSNPEVVEAVASSGIPFTLGTGASTLEEIATGLELAAEKGASEVVLMHGVQNFPTRVEDLHISRIQLLQDTFDIPVGYHDHVEGEDPFGKVVDLIAIGMGANVIEKHITLNRKEKGLDYQAALEPHEFKSFVDLVKLGYTAYGSKTPRPFSESELKYRKFQKKSIVAAEDIKQGEIINREKVLFSRNNTPGMAPVYFNDIDGKAANKDIKAFDNIQLTDLT